MIPTLCLLAIGTATAQPQYGWSFEHRADPGTEDLGILSQSLRLMPLDLRLPNDWQQIYRMESRFGPLYARRAGALTAVFPESSYAPSGAGSVPLIPANTMFVIGEPSPSLLRHLGLAVGEESILAPSPTRLSNAIDTSLDTRAWNTVLPTLMSTALEPDRPVPQHSAPPEPATSADAQPARQLSIWFNDDVRRRRAQILLDRALRVSTGR